MRSITEPSACFANFPVSSVMVLPSANSAFRDRRNKKRNFRALWIQRINAAARLEGMSYSKLMGGLHKAGIEINRKVLADLAMNHPEAFKAVVAKAKAA